MSTIFPAHALHRNDGSVSAGAAVGITLAAVAAAGGIYHYCTKESGPSDQDIINNAQNTIQESRTLIKTTGGDYSYNGKNEEDLKKIGVYLKNNNHDSIGYLVLSINRNLEVLKKNKETLDDRIIKVEQKKQQQQGFLPKLRSSANEIDQVAPVLQERHNVIYANQNFFNLDRALASAKRYDNAWDKKQVSKSLHDNIVNSEQNIPYLNYTRNLQFTIDKLTSEHQATCAQSPDLPINERAQKCIENLKALFAAISKTDEYNKAINNEKNWERQQEEIRVERDKRERAEQRARVAEQREAVRIEEERRREENRLFWEKWNLEMEKQKLQLEKEAFARERGRHA